MHLNPLLIDTLFVHGLLKVMHRSDCGKLTLFVVPLHIKVEGFEILQHFCLDLVDLCNFREDLATFIESEHVIEIHWTLRDPIYTYYSKNIEANTDYLKVYDVAHELKIGDDHDLVEYIENEES